MKHFERQSFISGIGQSAIGRRLGRSALDLTTESSIAAIADAGLRVADIDGICTYPGGDAAKTGGYGGPAPAAVQDALRMDLTWYQGSAEIPGQLGALVCRARAVDPTCCPAPRTGSAASTTGVRRSARSRP